MPGPLADTRHETFAQAIAKGATADAAYAEAGFRSHRGNAARLSADESIKARVAALQAEAARRTIDVIALTDADFINRLIREAAHYGEGASHAARVQAIRLIGDHLGLLKRKIEHVANDSLGQLLREISAHGSAAPIATESKTPCRNAADNSRLHVARPE